MPSPRRIRIWFPALLAVWLCAAPVAGAPNERAAVGPSGCEFVLGFAQLRDWVTRVEGADLVGECREDEYHTLSGDGFQRTTRGLLIWRKATNWTGFTDGQSTWINGSQGLQKRANTELLAWERAPQDPVAFLGQGAPLARLPAPIEMAEVVRQVEALHTANEGSTFNLYFGDMAGRRLYAVSLYPERGVVLEGRQVDLKVLHRFILDNLDLLRDPRVSVGTWFNADNGLTYLDVSATVPERAQAIQLARQYNQIAIFDLFSFEEIETGGTGTKMDNLPPADRRLPALWPELR
jgi:hypothetical protein